MCIKNDVDYQNNAKICWLPFSSKVLHQLDQIKPRKLNLKSDHLFLCGLQAIRITVHKHRLFVKRAKAHGGEDAHFLKSCQLNQSSAHVISVRMSKAAKALPASFMNPVLSILNSKQAVV